MILKERKNDKLILNYFIRFLIKQNALVDFIESFTNANNDAAKAGSEERNFLLKGMIPINVPEHLINDAFPWEYGTKPVFFWSNLHEAWLEECKSEKMSWIYKKN